MDKENYLVGPTTHGHVIMLQTYDSQGNILPVFQKNLDVDIVSAAVNVLGGDIDQNLLSIAYDYEGNLWFVTGGFHKNPAYSKAGFVGYLERKYIDLVLAGNSAADAAEYIHFQKLSDGENAENGIAAHLQGCVILTNKACYLFADTSLLVVPDFSLRVPGKNRRIAGYLYKFLKFSNVSYKSIRPQPHSLFG